MTELRFVLILTIIIVVYSLIAGKTAFHIIHPCEIGFYTKLGVYQTSLSPGVNITLPFISKVIKLDYSEPDWREQLRDIAIKLDFNEQEIKDIKSKIEEGRNKVV